MVLTVYYCRNWRNTPNTRYNEFPNAEVYMGEMKYSITYSKIINEGKLCVSIYTENNWMTVLDTFVM